MTTYYDYLNDRVLASSVSSQAQLEHLVHAERNLLWQRMVANPAYDEHSRMSALAAFDEAATRILSDHGTRLVARAMAPMNGAAHASSRAVAREPAHSRLRPGLRDALVFLLGAALGLAAGYYLSGPLARLSSANAPANALGVEGLAPSQKSFKLVKSRPSPLDGELTVAYAPGAPSDSYVCEVDATYRQILEDLRIDKSCRTVAFKFLPLETLWKNFNYLEGYMVFTATVMSPSGGKWQGSASVYFSIDGTT